MAEAKDLYRRLLPSLPGVSFAALDAAITDAASVFYRRTRTWKVMVGPINMPAGASEFPMNPLDDETAFCFVERAWVDQQPVVTTSIDRRVIDASLTPGSPGVVWVPDPLTVAVSPPSDGSHRLDLEVSIMPTGTLLPDFVLTHHYQAIKAGVLADMMLQPNKPYTNPALAKFYGIRFEGEIARAISGRLTGNGMGPIQFRFPVVSLQ